MDVEFVFIVVVCTAGEVYSVDMNQRDDGDNIEHQHDEVITQTGQTSTTLDLPTTDDHWSSTGQSAVLLIGHGCCNLDSIGQQVRDS